MRAGPWLSLPSRSSEGSPQEFQARGDSAEEAGSGRMVCLLARCPEPAGAVAHCPSQGCGSASRGCLGCGPGAETLGYTPTQRPREGTCPHAAFPTASCSPPQRAGSGGQDGRGPHAGGWVRPVRVPGRARVCSCRWQRALFLPTYLQSQRRKTVSEAEGPFATVTVTVKDRVPGALSTDASHPRPPAP